MNMTDCGPGSFEGAMPFPGAEISESDYTALSVGSIAPPEGLLEADDMAEGFVLPRCGAVSIDGHRLHHAFGRDGLGRCYYLGLVQVADDAGMEEMAEAVREELDTMRLNWVCGGGHHILDSRQAQSFLEEYCMRFGIPEGDYGQLLESIPTDDMEFSITNGSDPGSWDADTAMLMNDRAAILRYGGMRDALRRCACRAHSLIHAQGRHAHEETA